VIGRLLKQSTPGSRTRTLRIAASDLSARDGSVQVLHPGDTFVLNVKTEALSSDMSMITESKVTFTWDGVTLRRVSGLALTWDARQKEHTA
jgi:hypothetical protein